MAITVYLLTLRKKGGDARGNTVDLHLEHSHFGEVKTKLKRAT